VNPDQQENCQQCGAGLPRIRIEARSAMNEVQQPGKSQLQFRRGQVVAGRYTVLNLIGQGGMGCIYKVHDNTLGEDVALKTLLPQFLQDKLVLERFYNEAKIARRLAHPNIVRVHDIGEDGKILYISMEYLQGMSLREILDNLGPGQRLPIAQTLKVFDELCAALEYAHQFTVHRDIKPENVMIGQDGSVRLMDFGISKLMANTRLTNASIVMGTPFYMSPEQIKNSRDVDARADIYSVGVMLYEILTGSVPTGVPKPASQVTKDVPPALDKIVAKCVDPDPRERYQSASELRQAFQPVRQYVKSGISGGKTSLIQRTAGDYSLRKIAGAAIIVTTVLLALWGVAKADERRQRILAEPLPPVESTAPGTPVAPTMEEFGELVEQLQRLAGSTVKPGLNNAIVRGDELWASAQAATNPATALHLAGQAVQCYLAPLIMREGMVFVPPGPITLADAPIDVGGFLIDAHEVTVEQYQKFVASEPLLWSLPDEFKGREVELARHPISNVTFVDAQAYAAWSRSELPTEAQWARAAYGDSPGSSYPWEGAPEPGDCNVLFEPGVPNWPTPVGDFASDMSDFGCFDLVGNVSEWTRSTVPPLEPGVEPGFQSVMVVRGGNANEAPRPWNTRSTSVYEQKFLTLGFRTVVNIPSDPAGARSVMAGGR
jgi:tRNA A-37 threonylcarbamoyl transferase component Bud32